MPVGFTHSCRVELKKFKKLQREVDKMAAMMKDDDEADEDAEPKGDEEPETEEDEETDEESDSEEESDGESESDDSESEPEVGRNRVQRLVERN